MRTGVTILVLACAACANDLEKQSEVVKLRVLAIRADPAELVVSASAPPPRTTFTALAVDPSGSPATVRYAVCTEQKPTPSPTLDCPGTQGVDLPPAGDVSAVFDLGDPRYLAILAPDGGTADPSGLLREGLPVVLGFEARGPGSADGGAPQILRGYTTVVVHDDSRPANRNPELTSLRFGPDGGVDLDPGAPTPAPANTVERLSPVPAPDAKEQTAAGPEKLSYSFFATAGELSALRRRTRKEPGSSPGLLSCGRGCAPPALVKLPPRS